LEIGVFAPEQYLPLGRFAHEWARTRRYPLYAGHPASIHALNIATCAAVQGASGGILPDASSANGWGLQAVRATTPKVRAQWKKPPSLAASSTPDALVEHTNRFQQCFSKPIPKKEKPPQNEEESKG